MCVSVFDSSENGCGTVVFFQAEDGIRDLVRSRGLGDVYKRQPVESHMGGEIPATIPARVRPSLSPRYRHKETSYLSLIHI